MGSARQTGSNGSYRAVIEEEQVPYLRIEADGYETVESEIQLTNGVEGVRDFQLKRTSVAHSIRGTVLLPDGSPAVGVEVALCTAKVGVMLDGIAFEPGRLGTLEDCRVLTIVGRLTRKARSRSIPSRERTRWWPLGRPGWAACIVLNSPNRWRSGFSRGAALKAAFAQAMPDG